MTFGSTRLRPAASIVKTGGAYACDFTVSRDQNPDSRLPGPYPLDKKFNWRTVTPIRRRRIEQVKSRAGEQVKEPICAQAAIAVGVFDTCGHLIN